jgi:hypothetical protein
LEGLNVRLAFSEGETARLSGQMSIVTGTRYARRLQGWNGAAGAVTEQDR